MYLPDEEPGGGNAGQNPGANGGAGEDSANGFHQQQVTNRPVSARVTDAVGRGVFASGVLVQNGPQEFILDFILTTTRPHQVVARVVLPPSVLNATIQAGRQNIEKFESRFGPVPTLPKPPQPQKPPSVEEIYNQLKLPDDILSGAYANSAMISHSATEFVIDFITGFYPRASVSSRIFLAAPQMPRLLESLQRSLAQYQQRIEAVRKQQFEQGEKRKPEQSDNNDNLGPCDI